MLSIFDGLRSITLLSATVRLILAVICGGVIGIEREYKRRPAGFRTHILICLGACITTLTGQFLFLNMHYYTDMTRLGAQVIAGIGFIGAGTIIVTRRQRVKGLTTAAGLWAAAIIGLAIGGGFYEGGILVTLLIIVIELLFSRLEYRVLDRAPEINFYMEYANSAGLDNVLKFCEAQNLKVVNMEITRSGEETATKNSALFILRLRRHHNIQQVLQDITDTEGVITVREL